MSSANKGRPPRGLIVDDEKDVTLFLETALKDHGFEVTAFNDPLEALSSFKAGMYDLIRLDIRMPKMNGFDLYQTLQEIDGNARIGFMTAYEVYYEALRELFPDSYSSVCFIKKPFTAQDLVKRISKEMGREQ